jgi:hypothetical protein
LYRLGVLPVLYRLFRFSGRHAAVFLKKSKETRFAFLILMCVSSYAHVSANTERKEMKGKESKSSEAFKKRSKSGDHALPQRGFGLGTSEGAEGGWATREGASNCAPDQQQAHVHQQALPHQQQTPQPKGRKRQEASTQQQKQGEDKRTRSRKDPGVTACKSGGQPQGEKSQHAAPGARAQPQQRHQTRDPKDQATNQ